MNKKIGIFVLTMLVIGAGGSIALQSFAQTSNIAPVQPTTNVVSTTNQEDQNIDQKDANGKDLETNDDTAAVLGAEKESANDI